MRVQIDNNQLDLGTTPIENMFINTNLADASAAQLKVYIYAFMNAHSGNNNITNENIANEMNLTQGQVLDAWQYWINQGLVELKNDSYIFKSIRYQYISTMNPELEEESLSYNNYQEDYSNLLDKCVQDSVESKELIENIEQFISQGQDIPRKLDSREIRKVLELVNEFNVSSDFMAYAYMMASNIRGLKAVDPVVATIRNWMMEGATDLEKLEAHLELQQKKSENNSKENNNFNNTYKKETKLYEKDNRMTKEERTKLVEDKLKKKIPIKRRNNQ